MDLISRELTSLPLCLGALRPDCQSHRVEYPKASRKGIEQVVLNIDVLTQQGKDLLQNFSSGRLGRRIQWTIQSKDTVDRLRSSLETQKLTIEIACQCGSIQIICAIQKQVERPAEEFRRLTDTTQAIREDAEVLRRDAVEIKQLIRAEADALRVEISALQHGKVLSAEIQDFLRGSQEYSKTISDPFVTPEQSDAGLDDALTDNFSQTSLNLTVDDSFSGYGASQSGKDHNFVLLCPSCGHRVSRDSSSTNLPPKKPSSNTSVARHTAHKSPSEGFYDVVPSSDDSGILTTVQCGQSVFTTTFLKDAVFDVIATWFYRNLQQQEEKRRFWIPNIKSVADIQLTFNGSEIITYPGEKLSDLARIYGFGSVLKLTSTDIPEKIPDFHENFIVPSEIQIYFFMTQRSQ